MARTETGTASWGITDGTEVSVVEGVITDIEVGEEPQMEPQRNEIGAIIKQTLYDRRSEVNVTVEVADDVDKPSVGTQVTAAGVTGYVTRSRVTESNQRYRTIQMTLEAYTHCAAVEDLTNSSSGGGGGGGGGGGTATGSGGNT